jgi:D-amino-acid oxidase
VVDSRDDVIVVGAGVIGLSTAVRLAEVGLRVRVLTIDKPTETTSARAGAIWGPFLSEDPRVTGWSYDTLKVLEEISEGTRASGVTLCEGIEASKDPGEIPGYFKDLPHARVCDVDELPPGYLWGWHYRAPVVDMPVYMAYLERRFLDSGQGSIDYSAVTSLTDIDSARIVINCTGLAAGELTGDSGMHGLFGQLVVMSNPGITEFFAEFGEHDEVTYFMPQGSQIVLGGTIEPHHDGTAPDPDAVNAIIDRCAAIAPKIRDAVRLGVRNGLRPYRRTVRLEHTVDGDRHLIHNYGHGGSGVSVSWACADEVLRIVKNI